MAVIQRRFYESWRGPAPDDEDSWWLVFDEEAKRLLVRHAWQASGHSGFDEFEIAEFLEQTGDAQTALVDSLFADPAEASGRGRVTPRDASTPRDPQAHPPASRDQAVL
jgi:hypothetical protein